MFVVGFMMLAGITVSAVLDSLDEKTPIPIAQRPPTPKLDDSTIRNIASAITQGLLS